MKCPNCGLFNPDSAERCDCGYDWPTGRMKASYLDLNGRFAHGATAGRVSSLVMVSVASAAVVGGLLPLAALGRGASPGVAFNFGMLFFIGFCLGGAIGSIPVAREVRSLKVFALGVLGFAAGGLVGAVLVASGGAVGPIALFFVSLWVMVALLVILHLLSLFGAACIARAVLTGALRRASERGGVH